MRQSNLFNHGVQGGGSHPPASRQGRQQNVFLHVQGAHQVKHLENEPYTVPPVHRQGGIRHGTEIHPIHRHRAGIRSQQPSQHVQQSTFSGAACAHHGDELSPVHGKADIFQHSYTPGTGFETALEMADGNDGGTHGGNARLKRGLQAYFKRARLSHRALHGMAGGLHVLFIEDIIHSQPQRGIFQPFGFRQGEFPP